MANKRIKVRGNTLGKVDYATVAKGLGAEIVDIPELSKQESEKYEVLGVPVVIPELTPAISSQAAKSTFLGFVKYHGSKMLQQNGSSIDDVIGYRVLDADEEQEFRQQCANERNDPRYLTMPVVRYYKQKEE